MFFDISSCLLCGFQISALMQWAAILFYSWYSAVKCASMDKEDKWHKEWIKNDKGDMANIHTGILLSDKIKMKSCFCDNMVRP